MMGMGHLKMSPRGQGALTGSPVGTWWLPEEAILVQGGPGEQDAVRPSLFERMAGAEFMGWSSMQFRACIKALRLEPRSPWVKVGPGQAGRNLVFYSYFGSLVYFGCLLFFFL